MEELSTSEASLAFADSLHSHLEHHGISKKTSPSSSSSKGPHKARSIVKLSNRLAREKNEARKKFSSHPSFFLSGVRAHNKAVKAAKQAAKSCSVRMQERAFKRNPWLFSKSLCEDRQSSQQPTFSKQACQDHFESVFSAGDCRYQSLPNWVTDCQPPPEVSTDFDLSPITPGCVKGVLKRCSSKSSPGEDGISYHHLKKLPSTHHFLATLYSKILLQSRSSPACWCRAKSILIYKKGASGSPSNFRPIALTSCIGKLFHKIIARRLESFLLLNKIIDPTLQKGFLSGINGVMEHILSVNALLENARSHNASLAATFIDLRNAFGSVPHKLILDMLLLVNVPPDITTYIRDMYSKLSTTFVTKDWCTPSLNVRRGIFQGDTLSPILFLLAFNPILAFESSLPYLGSRINITVPNSAGLPPIGASLYTEWVEPDSDEPAGWYLCYVKEYLLDGRANLVYSNGALESVNLHSIKWSLTRKSSKSYLPLSSTLPSYPLKKMRALLDQVKFCSSSPHKVKGFADDMSIFSSSSSDLQHALTEIDAKCSSLDLEIRPDKCFSLQISNGKVSDHTFKIHGSPTANLRSNPTKFLGQTLGASVSVSRKLSSQALDRKITSMLDLIDKSMIRGDFKVWIYRNYLMPSQFFLLSVNNYSITFIKKLQAKATRFLKRWLRIPRSATLSILFHPKVLNLPYLPHCLEKAKLRCLTTTSSSLDPNILTLTGCTDLLKSGLSIPESCISIFSAAVQSFSHEVEHRGKAIKHRCSADLESSWVSSWDDQLDSLSVQSKFKDIVCLEPECRVWNRIISGLPSGQLSFLLRAGSDTLPTPLNLRRWKYRVEARCSLCSSQSPTVHHILSYCPVALDQGRLTWRHDSVLYHLVCSIEKLLEPGQRLYADLPGRLATPNPPSTIPPSISSTSDRPDMVLISNSNIAILELTVCLNSPSGFTEAHRRKNDKYAPLIADLEARGKTVKYVTLEIGTLGHFTKSSAGNISQFLPSITKRQSQTILYDLAKIAVSCSHLIFRAHNIPTWNSLPSLFHL